MIKNVAIYCRVSTVEQKKYGISIDDQKDSLTRYCKEMNYKIYDYYMDEGISAGSLSKRKEFLRLLDDLDNIDLILFTRLDRFSRNVRDANNILVTLDEHKTAFRAIDEDDMDVSTADGRFIFNLKVNLAERERNVDSERIRRVNKYKYEVSKKACTGRVAFGYKISKNKKIIINKKEAEIIKDLYNYFITTHNLHKTINWFCNKYGYKCSKSIKKYLKNTDYIGKHKTWKGEIIEDYYPKILDDDTFYNAQKIFDKNIKEYSDINDSHRKTPYIFSGLLKCYECNRRMSAKSNASDYHYYICRHYRMHKCNNNRCVTEKSIENYLINNIKEILKDKLIEIEHINSSIEVKDNTKIIKEKLNKLTDIYMNDLIDIDYYKVEYEKLKRQLEIEKANKPKKVNKETIVKINNFLNQDIDKIYNQLDNEEKRILWSSIVDYIVVKDKEHIDIIVY